MNSDDRQVVDFVHAFDEDGRDFIRNSARRLLCEPFTAAVPMERPGRHRSTLKAAGAGEDRPLKVYPRPKTFQHYVMNLPATAISFLDAFIGLYHGQERLFTPHTGVQRPMVHVYCFALERSAYGTRGPEADISQRISDVLECEIDPNGEDVHIEEVRKVAPAKVMYCTSFRLSAEVIFRGSRAGIPTTSQMAQETNADEITSPG